MSDLLEDEPGRGPGGNAPEYTVGEISGAVKKTIEGAFGRVRVRGEIGRVVRARSGHFYYDLKDDKAVLNAITWSGQARRLSVMPEEGMEVIAVGKLTTFPGQSKYQIIVDDLEPAGVGALMAMLEKRKAQLQAEGLFAAERKRPLPFLPEVIGVVTSPTGAVIRDILHRLRDRFPRHVLVWPVAVQGKDCAPQVANAIRGFNALPEGGSVPRPDVLIVARGGGSLEDLWGFNEEIVARAAAASEIPLISAVGHETDTTLIDFVSDRRAPTPTAAAEMAVPVRLDLLATVESFAGRMTASLSRSTGRARERLRDLERGLPRPEALLGLPAQRLDALSMRLPGALRGTVDRKRTALLKAGGALRPSEVQGRLRAAELQLAATLGRLSASGRGRLERASARLDAAASRLSITPLAARAQRGREDADRLGAALEAAGVAALRGPRERVTALARLLDTLSYQATLRRGYAVVRSGGEVVTTKARASGTGALELEFQDGRLAIGGGRSPKKPGPSDPEQGQLF